MTKIKKSLLDYLNNLEYLPKQLRDFHDQKDVFKLMQHFIMTSEVYKNEPMPNWVTAHKYTIDIFLWYMARCGYTLQKSKAKIDFEDLSTLIKENIKPSTASILTQAAEYEN